MEAHETQSNNENAKLLCDGCDTEKADCTSPDGFTLECPDCRAKREAGEAEGA